jgi:hypothetical protein
MNCKLLPAGRMIHLSNLDIRSIIGGTAPEPKCPTVLVVLKSVSFLRLCRSLRRPRQYAAVFSNHYENPAMYGIVILKGNAFEPQALCLIAAMLFLVSLQPSRFWV